ncbi:hypothetical protein C8Q74DRAFT_1373104 [Fomes fomentarius]|nr:hypothetical protein C8Q74DRAFT_1373104 [Fomes fomentarius]
MSTTELTLFCPDLGWFTRKIEVDNDVTDFDLKNAVSARMSTDSLNVYLVPHGLIKLPDNADPNFVRSALCEHAPSDIKELTRRNLKPWLDTHNPDEDELHLVVRLWCYQAINVFDMGTRKLRRVNSVKDYDFVNAILAKGNENHSVYQVPKGTKDSTTLSEDGVNSLNIATLQEVTQSTLLRTLAPWGFAPGELHFVLVPPDNSSLSQEDTSAPLPHSRGRFAWFDANPPRAPSSAAKPSQFRKAQTDDRRRIVCSRPDHLSIPPSSLLDETLRKLSHDMTSTTSTPQDIQRFERLRAIASQRVEQDGYVYGDIRGANVLVRNEAVPQSEPHVQFIDWDWAGS